MEMWNSIVEAIRNDPFSIAQAMTIGALVMKDLTVGFIRRKLDRRDTEDVVIQERLDKIEAGEIEVSNQQKALLALTDTTMKMMNNLTQNAKLPVDAKKYSNELIIEAGLLIKDYGLDNIEELTDTGRKKLLERIGNENASALAGAFMDQATDVALDAIPDSVRKFITPEN